MAAVDDAGVGAGESKGGDAVVDAAELGGEARAGGGAAAAAISAMADEVDVDALKADLRSMLDDADSAITGSEGWRKEQKRALEQRLAKAKWEAQPSPSRQSSSMPTSDPLLDGKDEDEDPLEARMRRRQEELDARMAADAKAAGTGDSSMALNAELLRLRAEAYAPFSGSDISELVAKGSSSADADLSKARADLVSARARSLVEDTDVDAAITNSETMTELGAELEAMMKLGSELDAHSSDLDRLLAQMDAVGAPGPQAGQGGDATEEKSAEA